MSNSKWINGAVLGLAYLGGCGDNGSAADSAESGGAATSADTGASTSGNASATLSGTATSPDTSATTTDDSDSRDGSAEDAKFDVGIITDAPISPCTNTGKGGSDPEFSYLWAANSTQGTISKIDTETVTEVGRFVARPDGNGSPSRTSVNLEGDVAVANRNGGVTKIYALEERCDESNGQAGIQTSTDSTFLPWGEEECVAWYSPFAYTSQRPVAWTQGEFNPTSCRFENANLWTAGTNGNGAEVLLLDGEDGAVIDMVNLPAFPSDYYGIYGGAVDAEGNFWGTKLGGVVLVRVDIDDMTSQTWPVPVGSYGMTVDSEGYVWACSGQYGRFDPETETWLTGNGGGFAGCMAATGEDGLLWMAGGNSLIGIDRHTLTPAASWPVPGSYGVSIDYYGNVWTVANGAGAHRVDPVDGTVTSYNGLVGAYTYSDMTGYALTFAGGGMPSG